MDDVTRLGRDAAAVLESPAFRKVGEEIRDAAYKAFCADDDDLAMEARRERQAMERIIHKLRNLQARGAKREKDQKKAEELQT